VNGPRTALAILAGRLSTLASRSLRRSATSLPGLVGLKIQPRLIEAQRQKLGQVIIVTGTNGKTTTARFIGRILEENRQAYVHNQSGSNLVRGIASSLIARFPAGHAQPWGLFEVDEATMPAACAALRPDLVIVTNLFRDQLDRYGELLKTAEFVAEGLAHLGSQATAILNADDPLVASLGRGLKANVRYYGIEDTTVAKPDLPHAADVLASAESGELLSYDAVYVGHLGHYVSADGDIVRPTPDVAATKVKLDGTTGSQTTITANGKELQVHLAIPGLYNVYNALAAASVGLSLPFQTESIAKALESTVAAFGRVEQIKVGEKHVALYLIKNPTGANEIIDTLALEPERKHVLIGINDNFADGTDVSWLWDADFEGLREQADRISVTGTRGADMAVRLKYAGWPEREITRYDSLEAGLDEALAAVPDGGTLYVLPTYTAMLDIRRTMKDRGFVRHYLR